MPWRRCKRCTHTLSTPSHALVGRLVEIRTALEGVLGDRAVRAATGVLSAGGLRGLDAGGDATGSSARAWVAGVVGSSLAVGSGDVGVTAAFGLMELTFSPAGDD